MKILWAIDHDAPTAEINKVAAKFAQLFVKNLGATIIPLSIVNLGDIAILKDLSQKQKDDLQKNAEDNCLALLKNAGVKNMTATVHLSLNRGKSHMVNELTTLANKYGAEMILIGSRNKKGLGRFFLGSFAESLLFTSTIPLFIITPEMKAPRNLSHAFIPHELIEGGEQENDKILVIKKFIQPFVKNITLYHYFGLGSGTKRQPPYIKEMLDECKRRLAKMKMTLDPWAKTKIVLIEKEAPSLPKSIIKNAQESGANFIVMKETSHAVKSFLVGSNTRNVVRYSDLPVLVLH